MSLYQRTMYQCHIQGFPTPDWGQITAPSQFNEEKKLPKRGVYLSQLLSSTFWRKFHENPIKNTKVTDT